MRKPHRLVAGGSQSSQKKPLPLLLALTILALFLILLLLTIVPTRPLLSSNPSATASFVGDLRPPKLSYLISSTRGEGQRVKRLLKAVYHPWNYYLLHFDLAVSPQERADLEEYVGSEPAFLRFGNVRVVGDADAVTLKGPTAMSSTLHAAAILLRWAGDWSWFINLDAADYPLMPQDDLLHIFSYLPRDLNFIEHTSNIGWKEHQRARPIIVDPGLYGSDKADVFWVKDRRSMPASFKLFAPHGEGYFHTVICNSMDFQNTTINHDLRFTMWDNQPRGSPLNLTLEHFSLMVDSGAPFARTFVENSPVLDRIDLELLKKSRSQFTPSGWCLGRSTAGENPCAVYDKPNIMRPTACSRRLEGLLLRLLDVENFRPRQCK